MTSKLLQKVLTTPSKVASKLDWKKAVGGTVLSLNIHQDRIGLALASHPSHDEDATTFEPIRLLKRGKVTEQSKRLLSQLVQDHQVCGFVVSFPLQQDSGRMGAACGRTLHTLDSLLQDTKIVTPNRPLCLWDSHHSSAEPEDRWGRSAAYTLKQDCSHKTLHIASEEQYRSDEDVVASEVWEDFCRLNWPDLVVEQRPADKVAYASTPAVPEAEELLWHEDESTAAEFVTLAVAGA